MFFDLDPNETLLKGAHKTHHWEPRLLTTTARHGRKPGRARQEAMNSR
jgi:hypothetical protein